MLKTAEIVFPGHPDKICDQIADSIITRILEVDPKARCAVEVAGGHGDLYVFGEVTTTLSEIEIEAIVSDCSNSIITRNSPRESGEARDRFCVQMNIVTQSPEIGQGVDIGGAGDNGIVTGFATRETGNGMPTEHFLARNLADRLSEHIGDYLDDGKLLLTLDDKFKIKTIVVNARGCDKVELVEAVEKIMEGSVHFDKMSCLILANTAGNWDIGGFDADTGLTGRKLVQDNYGSRMPIGGGAFSGKDGTKVDRSGAYRCRQFAMEILAGTPEVWEAYTKAIYAIGIARPTSLSVTVGTFEGEQREYEITDERVLGSFTPGEMIANLGIHEENLTRYAATGHFGVNAPWDKPALPFDLFAHDRPTKTTYSGGKEGNNQ